MSSQPQNPGAARRAAILGTGLIGSSIGIGLRNAGWFVTGWDPDPVAISKAGAVGAFDEPAGDRESATRRADLIVLAGPVSEIVHGLGRLDTAALVTDVAGVKAPVVTAGHHLAGFVGGHPMAGRETSGPAGASGSMFRGATWVLTTDGARPDAIDTLSEIVASLGANPVRMTATEHDEAVAAASHLPHVTAAALVEAVASHPGALDLAAGGFRDLTRVALSEPGWWIDVLTANSGPVADELRRMAAGLESLAGAVERADRVVLEERLRRAREIRGGMAAPVETVSMILEDRPGEMARVGLALSLSNVDLRDLQLRHSVHGGGGVLTLSVRAGEAARLREALEMERFRVLD
ncbi:MAG: prephenate dehydrogenase/arogenate dehydrogenase family protein [Acidimicrobiia bacterium]|nr:prephenate dehydrogenase/arogenate dehydrogenase family protein [Acidimicrobiia bacterium]MDH4306233.1 prephenate dehydrogenase/arogenate dehydrogenase family protein [Acidimicrobiia bacterium]MDH5293199.1 prephenate dehydrogenase/arogenate dehydrogenase family protein [Acidimicrobiia bacterium]